MLIFTLQGPNSNIKEASNYHRADGPLPGDCHYSLFKIRFKAVEQDTGFRDFSCPYKQFPCKNCCTVYVREVHEPSQYHSVKIIGEQKSRADNGQQHPYRFIKKKKNQTKSFAFRAHR
jgi:hypothetical protein